MVGQDCSHPHADALREEACRDNDQAHLDAIREEARSGAEEVC